MPDTSRRGRLCRWAAFSAHCGDGSVNYWQISMVTVGAGAFCSPFLVDAHPDAVKFSLCGSVGPCQFLFQRSWLGSAIRNDIATSGDPMQKRIRPCTSLLACAL